MLSFFANDWRTNRELLRPKKAFLETTGPARELNCLLLHGWHSLYFPLIQLENKLRCMPGGERIRFWRGTYDSHWKTFEQSADECVTLLERHRVKPANTVLIGFSMGGLVARSMVSRGFDARAVICLATPHLGAAPWMPVGDVGSVSIAPWSKKLARLNSNKRDIAHRDRYCFAGFDFDDITGYQDHDRIVRLRSSLGEGLPGVAVRHAIHLRYRGVAPGCDPHLRGMDPRYLAPVLEQFQRWTGLTAAVEHDTLE